MALLFSFHDGPPLNLWERCSLQSFADFGHELVLFSYNSLDVPPGVRSASAADIISGKEFSDFMRLAPDQFAQFSDWFRYELLCRHGNWWVDTDVVCTTASLPEDDVVVAKIKKDWLANGIIKFPAGHPLLAEAVAHCRSHWRDVAASHRSMLGPILLTELATKHELKDRAWESTLLYPVQGRSSVWKLADSAGHDEMAAALSGCPVVHWWQWRFRAAGIPRDLLPPKGSFLAELFLRHGGHGHPHLDVKVYREVEASRRDKPQSMSRAGVRLAGRPYPLLRRLGEVVRGVFSRPAAP